MELDKIYVEDCLATLDRMEDNSIDLIITSPPYNRKWYQTTYGKKFRVDTDYGVYDDCLPPEEYEKWQREVISKCLQKLKPTGSLFYNHIDIQKNNLTIHPTYVYDFPLVQPIIWDKGSTPKVARNYFYPTIEYIFWFKKDYDSRPYFNRDDADFQNCVWHFLPQRFINHPAPFPLELPTNIIKSCSKEGDIVYDPFMGSGTTALAAKMLGRHYIGSELNPEYAQMSEERLNILY